MQQLATMLKKRLQIDVRLGHCFYDVTKYNVRMGRRHFEKKPHWLISRLHREVTSVSEDTNLF
jgi:hypothetical protein